MSSEKNWSVPASLLAYMRRHIKTALMLALFCAVFAVILYLSDLPMDAVGYGALLCVCLGGVFFIVGFLQFRARCKLLSDMQKRVNLPVTELPAPRDEIERLYTELIAAMDMSKTAALTAADRARSEALDYYTMWAHQIKTPISAMRVLLTPAQTELRLELNKIEQYVEMVLQYQRLDSPSGDLVIRRIDLDGAVRQAVRKLSPIFIHKKLTLNYEPLNRDVLTDEKWLVFMLEQLLANALKYTRQGSITIEMDKDAPCTLRITDTGIGIRSEDLPRVFEKGYTGYNGRIDKRSTGIGLYLCKRIAEKLSHKLSITSAPGEGTAVSLDLSSADIRHE